jgi:hypothetical protein
MGDGLGMPMNLNILDDICLTSSEGNMEGLDPMRLSFGGEMGAFSLSGYLNKVEEGNSMMSNHDGEDDEFKMWALKDNY